MINKLKFFALAGCALMLFTACSNDDEPSKPKVKMKIAEMSIETTWRGTDYYTEFSYDEEGRINSYKLNNETVRYEYGTNRITRKKDNADPHVGWDYCVFLLENGKIISDIDGLDIYKYNGDEISQWTEEGWDGMRDTSHYTWSEGNLIKEDDDGDITFRGYNSDPNYAGFIEVFIDDTGLGSFYPVGGSCFDPFLSQQGLYGNPPKNLLSSLENNRTQITIKYELNSNGYPTKIIAEEHGITRTINIVWK